MSTMKSNKEKEQKGFTQLLKKLWPSFLLFNSFAFTISFIFINILIVSNIIWPGEPFHSVEIGLMVGLGTYATALSGILFGVLADRFSRIKLMALMEGLLGIGFFINGFVPAGLGRTTFIFFLVLNIARGFASGGIWPLINSYANDSTEEKERSQFFGLLQALFQITQIIGMLVSALLFQNNFWREMFWICGGAYILFAAYMVTKAREPKRAATHKELRDILEQENINYEYKLNWGMVKMTILKPTNIVAFFEGIFTTIIMTVPDFLLTPYFQSPPHNISPLALALFMIIFGLPGGIFGSIMFAKLSDKLAQKNIKYRVYMIVVSIISLFIVYIILFSLRLPELTPEDGNNLIVIFQYPIFWILGFIAFIARAMGGLWSINQPPILQSINLPEAQGTVSSANQFLEAIGNGTGPIIAGTLLMVFGHDYQITIVIIMSIGIIGAGLWLLATIWINRDVNRISRILKERGMELKIQNGYITNSQENTP